MDWIREHPYLSGTLAVFVVVLFLVLRGRSAGSGSVQTGPSDAVIAAQLSAGVQQQSIQAAATVQTNQTQAALEAALANVQAQREATAAAETVGLQQILTGGSVAEYQAAAGVQAQQSSDAAAVDIASTTAGADVQKTAIGGSTAVQLGAQQVQIAGIQGQTQAQLATIAAPIALASISDQLAAVESGNQTAAAIASTNAGAAIQINATQEQTKQLGIKTGGDVATNIINEQAQAEAAQLAAQQQVINQAYTALPGVGGSPNRVAIISATLNQPAIGTAAEGASAASAVSGNNIWSSFWGGLFGAAGKVGTAAVA